MSCSGAIVCQQLLLCLFVFTMKRTSLCDVRSPLPPGEWCGSGDLYSVVCGDLTWKEIQKKRGYVHVYTKLVHFVIQQKPSL